MAANDNVCPHCGIRFNQQPIVAQLGSEPGRTVLGISIRCPSCGLVSIWLQWTEYDPKSNITRERRRFLVLPNQASRPCPAEVPGEIAREFQEASAVLPISPNAAAALARRLLQRVLREEANASGRDLAAEIESVVESNLLPADVAEDLDAVRRIGNFAAHPNKSKITGEIVDAEPDEAVWTLDILESLFDVLYVQPARRAARRAQFNAKAEAEGRSPLRERGTELPEQAG